MFEDYIVPIFRGRISILLTGICLRSVNHYLRSIIYSVIEEKIVFYLTLILSLLKVSGLLSSKGEEC